MKDEKKLENKGKGGFQFETKADQAAEKKAEQAPEEDKEEPVDQPAEEDAAEVEDPGSPAPEVLEEEEPSWLEKVIDELKLEYPQKISRIPDEDLLEVKGVGPATLEDIRTLFPYQEPKSPAGPGQVMIRVRPMRGIGGVGKEGTEAPMDRELAEQYQAEGYVDILE